MGRMEAGRTRHLQFVDPTSNDYHLGAGSPSIDAGDKPLQVFRQRTSTAINGSSTGKSNKRWMSTVSPPADRALPRM